MKVISITGELLHKNVVFQSAAFIYQHNGHNPLVSYGLLGAPHTAVLY